ncbi:MAG: hypothetical protein ACRC8P_00750 [Spiroplasma sp.]
MKFSASQITILTKNQIQLFFKNYKFDIFLAGIFLVNLLLDIIGLVFINSDVNPSEKWIKVNILIVLNSLLVVILTIYVTINCFVGQIKNNIHKTELRYGYKVKNIYLSRILFIVGFSTFYLLAIFIVSLLFFGFNYQNQDLFIYRLYLSSFAWYAILIFLSIVITLLLTRFLAESFATILSTILAILFILTPALVGLSANMSRSSSNDSNFKDYSYELLINENYKRNLYHDLMSDEATKNIYQDFQFVSEIKDWNDDELLMGWKVWNLKPEEFAKIKNYVNLVTIVQSYFENNANQISSWNKIQEFHETSNIINEPITKIIIKLQTVKEMEKYNFLLKTMKNYTNNFSILRSLDILHQLGSLGIDNSKEITSKYKSSEEYLFVRTLNVLFFKLSGGPFDSIIVNPIEIMREAVKKDKIANIFNPLRHFNLMFQSIDYNNKFLFNFFGKEQMFYANVANINFSFSGDSNDLSSMLKLKQNVPIEIIYTFYLVLGSLLIWLAFLRFNKKIKQ